MTTTRSTFLALPVFLLPQLLIGGSPLGYVIEWGADIASQRTEVVPIGVSTGAVTRSDQHLTNVVTVAAGTYHALALMSDGTVVGWGSNGRRAATGFDTPYPHWAREQVRIAGQPLSKVTSISASCDFSLALRADGKVVSWGGGAGEGEGTQLQVPSTLSNVVAVAAGCGYGLALTKEGIVESWGARSVPSGLSNATAISAGTGRYGPSLALRKDGTVFAWNSGGHEMDVPLGLSNVVAIAAGGGHCLALKNDGTIVGWGANSYGEATGSANRVPPFYSSGKVTLSGRVLSNAVSVAAGSHYSIALRTDGKVVAWGRSDWHTTEVPVGLSNVVAISAGEGFCLAITTNSQVAAAFGSLR